MKWRVHGANPNKLYKQFNIEMPEDVIDFSDNANAIKQETVLNIKYENYFDEYPDDEVFKLKEFISKKESLSINNILFTNGTNEAIYIIASYYQNKTVAILHPTYSEYELALIAFGVNVSYVYDLNEVNETHAALIVCNPNNPTGRYYDYETLDKVINRLKKINVDLIIDEAYVDFMNVKHKTLDVINNQNIYILRSLTKFYHLSGLRIGYLLSHQANINKIKRRQPTWSVNSIAQIVAYEYLNDVSFIKKTKLFYEKERNRIFNELKLLNFEVLDSKVNFFVMKVDDDESLIKYLLTKGIVVRHTRNFPKLLGKYIRITIKSVEENNYLIKSLKEYLEISKKSI